MYIFLVFIESYLFLNIIYSIFIKVKLFTEFVYWIIFERVYWILQI